MSQFQSTVNIYNSAGVPGTLAASGPLRSQSYNIDSNAAAPNYFGYAYTLTDGGDPDPSGAAPNAGTAQVGGTGFFAGLLVGPQEAASFGTTAGGPLAPVNYLPDNAVGELVTMGSIWAYLPGPANVGDLVTYDPATGALNSVTPNVNFTGSIAAGGSAGTPDVLTVSALAGGAIYVGMPVIGAGIAGGTTILSLGTGLGGTGTYNLSTINLQTVSSRSMSGPSAPAPAFSVTATFATNVMTVATVVSGTVRVGDQIFGAGIPANTVVTALGTGVGGTGTYTLNNTVGTITPAISVTGPANRFVPNAVVDKFDVAGTGLAVIKLTN